MDIACSQCGESFDPSDLVTIKGLPVCVSCKPILLKKIQEGYTSFTCFIYKGFWIRLLAEFIDGIILIILFIGFVWFWIALNPFSIFSILNFLSSINIFINIIFYVFFNGRYGATPGKMIIGAKIVNTDGSPISYTKAFARFFAEMLSWFIFGIGYIMAAFDSQKRTLHDRICNTLVIKR